MADNPYFNMEQSDELMGRRQQALGTMGKALAKRAAERQELRERLRLEEEQRQQQLEAEYQQAQRNEATDWHSTTAQGMQLGSVGGPYGMAAGAIIGAALGQGRAIAQRKKEGQGTLGAIGRTLFDFKPLTRSTTQQRILPMAAKMGGKAAGKYMSKPETKLRSQAVESGSLSMPRSEKPSLGVDTNLSMGDDDSSRIAEAMATDEYDLNKPEFGSRYRR